jgi:drug/metabolite transporter (DMT)-like permease
MLRVIIAMTVASGATATGQILIRRGMQAIGPLETYAPLELMAYFAQALSNPYVIGGTALNAVFYFLLLTSLSWAGVTVALPFSALEYGFAAILAVTILQEQVTPLRWVGILFVVLGIILISMSHPPEPII